MGDTCEVRDNATAQSQNRDRLFVAAVGASAGGLEALERFFKGMPHDTGIAFVIIQHLSPDFKSVMDELLARHTHMPIHRVEDGMQVAPNAIFLMPPRKEMIISGGRLLLTDKDPQQELSLPIDHFFRSLAHDAGRCGIAIVLSGTGSDGSRGIRDVHEAGGLVIAQSPETAKFDGMPRSACDAGIVDAVLSPEEMPRVLVNHVRTAHQHGCRNMVDPTMESTGGVADVFKLLRDDYGIDFSYYKPNTVTRRIERRLSLSQVVDLAEYVERLRSDPAELNSLYRDLLIGVTRFFRDREAFNRLERHILPDLLARRRPGDELRLWVAGCATGEEAYSLAILLHEQLQLLGRPVNVKIFATDVHKASLDVASTGIYPEEALAEVRPARMSAYFTRKADGYHVSNELRQMIVFARHNIIKDAPFTRLDLITCRNLLIYFQPAAQKKVLALFHFGLRTGGVLFLGPSETPGELGNEFETLDEHWKLYRKRRDIRLPADMRLPLSTPALQSRMPTQTPSPLSVDGSLVGAYDRLLEEYIPPGLLVNDRRQLVHAFGGAGKFLIPRDGRPTTDILELVDSDLKLALAGSLQRAAKDQTPVVYTGVRLRTATGEHQYKLSVRPILNRQSNLTHLFISFEALDAAPDHVHPPTELDVDAASREHVSSLESELRHARENLQATIEELETSNEELQASNEELVASNEELQSTNEELHSVNEELYTVNAEYQKKISELTELTDDMDNLLRSTEIGTIFLDRDLCIRKFTPQIARAFDLLPQDIGRRIDTFSPSITCPRLLDHVSEVARSGTPIQKEVRDRHGNWLFLRILPYRSHSAIEGVVLTLIDISLLKRAEATLQQMSAIVESSNDAIVGMDMEGRITSWNQGATDLYGYTVHEMIGTHISRLHPDSGAGSPEWPPDVLERMRAGVSASFQVEGVRRRKDGAEIHVLMSFSPIRDPDGVLVGVSMIGRDITSRKRAEEEAREAVRRRDQFLAILSHELRNPLAAIVNASHLLAADDLDHEALDMARGVIARQSQQMSRLLDDLLDVSRVNRDKIEIRRQVVDLRKTSRDALEAVRAMLASRKLKLDVELPDEPLQVDGDPARLQQIQVNLLNNAIKYTPDGGCIRLSLSRDDRDAIITVQDTGIGIPADMRERIFDLFVQLDGAPGRPGAGMGVGLTLVRSLVRLHGGQIFVHSEGPGKGSEFRVHLPFGMQQRPQEPPDPARETLAERHVLVIEDNPDIRSLTGRLLRTLGCRVLEARDGPEGVEIAIRHRPDVVLVDIGLPGIDGYEVARRVRELPGGRSLRLIAVTGFGQPEDRQRALEAGFNAHLVKPVDVKELTQVLSGIRSEPA